MKKIILAAAMSLLAVACGTSSKGVLEFISSADGLVGKEVVVEGTVKHVCSHSGRRCFLFDEADPTTTLRVEAGTEIGTFEQGIVGSQIVVTGIVEESRISDEELATMEKEYQESIENDGVEAHCGSELQNVQSIRKKLKAEGKDYLSTYSITGTKYEVK